MRLTRRTIITVAVAAVALATGVSPAAGQDKVEPARSSSDGDARARAVEAAGSRASQFAEARGALGSYYDAVRDQHVIVVSRGENVRAADASRAIGASARVEERDVSLEAVEALQRRIAGRTFADGAASFSYASYLDLRTGKVVLTTDAPDDVTAALHAEFPGLIHKQADAVRDDFSRQADTTPFWGGGSIGNGSGTCSSAFSVQKNGARYMLTAGHCFSLWSYVYTSAGAYYGYVAQRGPIPPYDMELITGSSYGSYVFTGGTNSSTGKHVQSAGDPVVGFVGYCRSGRTTGEQCNQRVDSVTAQVCTATGCKSPVIAYSNGGLSQPGDSGAPFYIHNGSYDVQIRGMHIASGGSTMYAEKWSRISANLGVAIVT